MNTLVKAATTLVKKLRNKGYEAYFAGGYVRDMILSLDSSPDIDIATNASPATVESIFSHTTAVGAHFGVVVVKEGEFSFDVATFRSDVGFADGRHPEKVVFSDAQTDALRRDFTINGLFYDPLESRIIDYVNGIADIQKKIVRTIGNPLDRFQEDYLRMLRAIRFAAKFQFTIEDLTWEGIKRNASQIVKISKERIFQELTKMLTGPHASLALSLCDQTGLLLLILPEVSRLKGVEQPPEFHPEGDVFTHTLKTLDKLDSVTPIIAWAALLHDIGKPHCYTNTDRVRFNNHQQIGADLSIKILKRLKAPQWLISGVYECIVNHMNFINVQQMRLSTLKKFLQRSTIQEELTLHKADCLASHENIDNYFFLKKRLHELSDNEIRPEPLVLGRDLIALGMNPSPLFGEIIKKCYELQLDEQITTKEEALEWIKKHLLNSSSL